MSSRDGQQSEATYHGSERTDVLALLEGSFGTVLDVGGGTGATSGALKRAGRAGRVDLIDLHDRGIEPLVDRHLSIDLEDTQRLQEAIEEQGQYDLILCLDVLEHTVDPWRTVEILREGLAVNGLFVASIPNIRHYTALRDLAWRGEWTYRDFGLLDRTHLRFFVRSSMIDLLEAAALRVERIEPLVKCGKKMRALHRVMGSRIEEFVALQYVLFARREDIA